MDWEDHNEEAFEEGNIVDMISNEGIRKLAEIVTVHCFVCCETFVGPKDKAGLFIKGHKEFHIWEIELSEILGGA
tara:strand:- start:155 stop:379 length:225 start_codon:yes stop_codon:yes gene_type:complete